LDTTPQSSSYNVPTAVSDASTHRPPYVITYLYEGDKGVFMRFGDEESHFPWRKGFRYLQALLTNPNTSLEGMALVNDLSYSSSHLGVSGRARLLEAGFECAESAGGGVHVRGAQLIDTDALEKCAEDVRKSLATAKNTIGSKMPLFLRHLEERLKPPSDNLDGSGWMYVLYEGEKITWSNEYPEEEPLRTGSVVRTESGAWTINFGSQVCTVPDSTGMRYIARILGYPAPIGAATLQLYCKTPQKRPSSSPGEELTRECEQFGDALRNVESFAYRTCADEVNPDGSHRLLPSRATLSDLMRYPELGKVCTS
jgi:hypothetical protein